MASIAGASNILLEQIQSVRAILYTTGGAQRSNEILGRVIDCDSPRVYLSDRVSTAAQAMQ